ncbi:MAG: DNA starvation/stationary phase protection protein Dps [Alphaproteobacteria bacterium]|nr:DNA starvation/stationary phase protection protein Dps [Alphaproteobacteria bacterium]
MQMHKTRNDLKSNTKTTMAALLNARLVDAIDLALMTKQAHWNLRGRQFIAVHEMLDGFRTEIDGHVDTIAERVAQLGGIAFGTTQAVVQGSKLKTYPTNLVSVEDHIAALGERYGDLANSTSAAIGTSDEAGDADTADIFTAVSRSLDKALWFLEAHEADKA